MLEADTAITDFILSALSLFFAWKIQTRPNIRKSSERWIFLLLFYSVSLSALAGGIAHGYYSDAPQSIIYRILWVIIFFSVAFATYSMTHLASVVLEKKALLWLLSLFLVPYFIYSLMGGDNFLYCGLIALLGQLIFLLCCIVQFKNGNKIWNDALFGCIATAFAMSVQINNLSFANLSASAVFHLIQCLAMYYYFQFSKKYLGQY